MRIAFVTGWLSRSGGGLATVVAALSRAIAMENVETAVFGLEDELWCASDAASWSGASVHALAIKGPRALGYSPRMTRRLSDWSPDVVHVHGIWMHHSRCVLQWTRATSRPYLISPHGMLDDWALANARWKKRIASVLYERAHLRQASALHALCQSEAQAITRQGLNSRLEIIPNGVDIPTAVNIDAPPWQQNPDTRVMLYLGRLHPKKNLPAFLEAWSQMNQRQKKSAVPWMLVVAGWDQTGHGEELKRRCHTLGLAEQVHFTGPLFGAEKHSAFRNADAFVLPSLSEGLPMSVLEAWSYGLPVLMTDHCNLTEAFAMGAAHRLQVPGPLMTTDLTAFLARDRAALKQMGDRGRRLISERYQWSKVAQSFIRLYCELKDVEAYKAGKV